MKVMPIILGLESSCDETAAALVTADRQILAHRLAGQEAEHRPYGGVVPEIAARAHVEALMPLVEAALADAKLTLADVDAIAATAGPGLIGGVMVGLVTGKALAHAAGKPLVAVNHLEGHALSPRLADPDLQFPYLLLLVSGGHCQLLEVRGVGAYRRLGTTIDDAAGEAFDKTAKLLRLGIPGGPRVEALAREGDPKAVPLPRPLLGTAEPHFSFAGLKSAVMRAVESGQWRPADIAASFQQAVVDCLVDRTRIALERFGMPSPFGSSEVENRKGGASRVSTSNESRASFEPDTNGDGVGPTALVVAGGVAANGAVRAALQKLAADNGLPFVAPPLWLCTDNAAMIGWAGAERFAAGLTDDLDFPARPRWPLDPEAETVRGAGVKA
jgi:N6-L-threonylcarbamoyladenine synthase